MICLDLILRGVLRIEFACQREETDWVFSGFCQLTRREEVFEKILINLKILELNSDVVPGVL